MIDQLLDRFDKWHSGTLPEPPEPKEGAWHYIKNMDDQTRKRFFLGGLAWLAVMVVTFPLLAVYVIWEEYLLPLFTG